MKNSKLFLCGILIISSALFVQMLIFVATKNQWINLIDNNIATFLSNNRIGFFDYLFVLLSYLGETKTIFLFCLILLALPNRKQIGVPVTIITVVCGLINFAIKYAVARTRPEGFFLTETVLGYTFPDGYSFPSGHSQTATMFYFSLALLLSNKVKQTYKKNILIYSTIGFCFLMSFSRIYLGVHFFSDVFAGIVLMIAILSLAILICQNTNLYKLNNYK